MSLTSSFAPAVAFPAFTWRALRVADSSAIMALLFAVAQADQRMLSWTEADLRQELSDPACVLETDSLAAFTAEGAVVAFARVFLNPQLTVADDRRAHIDCEVDPVHRNSALLNALLDWAEARAQQRLAALGGTTRVCAIRVACQDNLTERIALFEARGYRSTRAFYRMRRDLHQPIPKKPLPEGLTALPYSPEWETRAFDAFEEAFSDHWGFEPTTIDEWRMYTVRLSSFRADLTLLAISGEDVVGFSINRVHPEENARSGLQQGWIGQLGTRRAWRKRGLATALLCHSMRLFKNAGLTHAGLGVDAENLTGALALYERLGFYTVKRNVVLEKSVE